MKKRLILSMTILLILSITACTGSVSEEISEEEIEEENTSEIEEEIISETEEDNLEEEIEEESNTQEFSIIASEWEFDTSTITVNEGDTVILHLISEDVTHGFSLSDFDISETLSPGDEVTIEFIADKEGSFTFSCSVPCGSGHSSMTGEIIVQ
tara:strand:+ start:75 stop:536 length:462 start_codon:yes stop_codon:yes gene_type:complete